MRESPFCKVTFLKETFLTPPYFTGDAIRFHLFVESIFKVTVVGVASWVMEVSHGGGRVVNDFTITTKCLSIRNGHFGGG